MLSVASVGLPLRMAPNPLEDDMDARDRIGKVRIALTCRHRWLASGSLSVINRRQERRATALLLRINSQPFCVPSA